MVIKGRTVQLHVQTSTSNDEFGVPIYTDSIVSVDNVLIQPGSDIGQATETNLHGKASEYTLHIPKGDSHIWTDTIVEFFGKQWKTVGDVTLYQEELLPLDWKGSIKVEHYG